MNVRAEGAMTIGHDPVDVARYMLWKASRSGNPLTPMQVLKLVYIAHGWCLALFGRPLSSTPAEAWQYGPVIPPVYHRFKRFGGQAIDECPPTDPDNFDERERHVLDQVWAVYGHLNGIVLSSMTHQPGTPWDITVRQSGLGSIIADDLIEQHYRQLQHDRSRHAAQ